MPPDADRLPVPNLVAEIAPIGGLNPDQLTHLQIQPEQFNNSLSCAARVLRVGGSVYMAREVGQIMLRGARIWVGA